MATCTWRYATDFWPGCFTRFYPPLLRHGWHASTSSFCFWELAKASRALRACMLWINFQAGLAMSSRPHGTQRTCECKDLYCICFKIGDSSALHNLLNHLTFKRLSRKLWFWYPKSIGVFPFTMTKSGWLEGPDACDSLMTPICMRSAKLKTALISASWSTDPSWMLLGKVRKSNNLKMMILGIPLF